MRLHRNRLCIVKRSYNNTFDFDTRVRRNNGDISISRIHAKSGARPLRSGKAAARSVSEADDRSRVSVTRIARFLVHPVPERHIPREHLVLWRVARDARCIFPDPRDAAPEPRIENTVGRYRVAARVRKVRRASDDVSEIVRERCSCCSSSARRGVRVICYQIRMIG